MEKLCSLCKKTVDSESAAILVMGGFGNPKYICEECVCDLDIVTEGRDCDNIKAAMARIGEKLEKNSIDDELVVETMSEIFTSAKDRAEAISAGTYDFSIEETEQECDDIPEELKETEEDRLLDEAEKLENEKNLKNFDKFVFYPVLIGCGIGIIYFLIRRFFF